jgi:HSP20 family protein
MSDIPLTRGPATRPTSLMSGSSSWGELENLRRELGAIASCLQEMRLTTGRNPPHWEPAVNVYRCESGYVVCVELAGITAESLEVRAEPRRLRVRGTRPPPEPEDRPAVQVLCMEIDYGPFERGVQFPLDVDVDRVAAERRDGLLWIHLPLSAEA